MPLIIKIPKFMNEKQTRARANFCFWVLSLLH